MYGADPPTRRYTGSSLPNTWGVALRKSKAANETSIQNNTALSQSALLAEEEEGEEE